MTKWLSDEIQDEVFGKIQEIDKRRGKIEEEEIDELIPAFKKHFSEQWGNPIKARSLFQDEHGGTVMLLKTPEKIEGIEPTKNGSYLIYPVSALLETSIKMFTPRISEEELDKLWDKMMIARGKMNIDYKMLGEEGYGVSLTKFLNKHDLESLAELDPDDYLKGYTFNLKQVLAVVK